MWGRYLLIGALFACFAIDGARAEEIDTMLVPGDKLRTQLVAGGGKTVAVAALAGTKLSVTFRRIKPSSVEPRLLLADPDGIEQELGKRLKTSKKIARVKGYAIDRTGLWRASFFALSGGGDVEISVSAKLPKRLKWKGTLTSEGDVAEHRFAALPGSRLTLQVKAKGGSQTKWSPIVEILDPDGNVLLPATAKRNGRTPIFADLFGEYVIRVSGGPGTFSAKMSVVAPNVKGRTLTYKSVEALPRIDSSSPDSLQNDDTRRVTLVGIGFSARQSITLSTPERGYVAARVDGFTDDGVYADLDLTGVPPGEYRLGVTTTVGNSVYADAPYVVTNRPPGIVLYSAPEFPAYEFVPLKITGRGFDDDCVIELRRSIDGLRAPTLIVGQDGHTIRETIVAPPAYQVGAYDVTVRDPSGESRTFEKALEIVGYKAEPTDMRSRLAFGAWGEIYPRDAVYVGDADLVFVAMVEANDAVFVLFDPATSTVKQTFIAKGTLPQPIRNPRVAWNPIDGTLGMAWIVTGSTEHGFVRICSASDLDDELSSTRVAVKTEVTQVDIDANTDDGGWIAVWEEYNLIDGSEIRSRHFASDGIPSTTNALIFQNDNGLGWSPTIVYRGDGTYIVGHVGGTKGDAYYALRRIVLTDDGAVLQGSSQVASSITWFGLFQPEVALNPATGDVLVCFSYRLYDRFRPGFVLLTGSGASPGAVRSKDGEGLLPQGLLDGVAWNPERNEYVVGLSLGDGRVAVRRVAADALLKPAYVLETYEGMWAVPWSGAEPGQLGLLRAYDGEENGYDSPATDEYHVRAGPLY